MYAMERLSRYIAQGVYSVSNPFHPFGGAVDIVVVQQQDGTFKSSPWYVKFGKFQGVLKAKEKIVAINVNGIEAEFHMMLSHKGEAYFLLEMDDDTQEQSSEDDIIQHSCNIAREKEPIVVENSQILNSVSQIDIKTRNTGTGTSSSRSKFFKLMFGREGDKTDDSNIQRNSSLDRAEIAANLLEMKWTTNISMKNIETHDDCSSGETFASEARGADNAYLSIELSDNDSIGKQYNPTDANVASLKGGKLHDKLEESVTSYDIKKSASESLLDRRLYSESHVTGCHDKKQTFEEKYCVSMLGPSDGYCNMNKICTKTFLRTSKNSSTGDPIFDGEILESSNLCHNLRMGEGLDNGCESKVLPGCTKFRQSLENENFTESGNRISQKSINDINISEESPSFHFLSKIPCVDQMEFVDYHKKERNSHEIDLKPNEVQSVKECSISYNPDFMQKDKLQSENLNNFVPNEVQLEYPSFTDSCDILQLEYPRFTDSSDVQSVKKGLESHDAHHEIYLSSNPYIEAQPALETVMNPVGILRENTNINYPNSINMSQKQTLIGKFQRSLPNLQILNHELELCDTHSSRKSFDSNSEYLSCNTNRDDVSSSSGKTTSIHEKEKLPDLIQIKDFAKIIESWDTEKNQFVANDTAVEVSLCRSLLYKGMGAEAASKAFDSEKLDLSMFATLEPSSLGNKQLILRIGGCYYPFNATLPFIFGKMSLDQVKAFNPESPIVEGVEEPLEGHISTHVVASNGSWKLWPFNFRKSKTIGARDLGMKISEVDESSKSIKDGRKDNKVQKAPVKRKLKQSFIPTSEQLASLNLNEGKNVITFAFSTTVLGHQQVDAKIYLWKWNTRIVVSDVDGTITKSDVLGQFMPLVGRDWSQIGVTRLFSSIKENGYELLFLSARSIFQAYLTRQFLLNLKQDGMVLPDGPVVISPDGLFPSLYREVIRRAPHEFKISCLEVIRSLFPSDHNPFYAGFGNRETDEISYLKIGIPQGKIFTINPKGEVAVDRSVNTKSYYSFHSLVNDMFPSMSSFEQEEFNSWNYWKLPLPNVGF